VDKIRIECEGLNTLWSKVVGGVVVQEGCGLSTDVKGVNQSRKIQVEVTEAIDRERRKKNLIIRGIPETKEAEEYKDNVNNMIRDLMEGKYVKYEVMERIRRKENGVRPIKILVEENAQRRQLLAKAKHLNQFIPTRHLSDHG